MKSRLADGVAGLSAIKSRGGFTIAQSRDDARFAELPENAMEAGVIDIDVAANRMADELVGRLRESIPDVTPTTLATDQFDDEDALNAPELDERKREILGPPSGFSCPDCGGGLWDLHDCELVRYRSRVGHAHSPESLMAALFDEVEEAMWTAYRSFEERAGLARRARAHGLESIAEIHDQQEADALGRARELRRVLEEKR